MTPKSPDNSFQLFQSHLDQILDPDHRLIRLAKRIDWSRLEKELEPCYSPDLGRPGCSTRLLVGLHYLKYAFDESDESVVDRWVENPYWQYFCGYEYMQHACPLHPTTLVKWRQRVGAERMTVLVEETIATALRTNQLTERQVETITVDTTVQEKAIAFPTDARLYYKALRRLGALARQRKIPLRQSYVRVSKKALARQSRYAHAKQVSRARRQTRRLKTWLGRIVRDIERKTTDLDAALSTYLERAKRLLAQERNSRHKLYSIDAPEVECISKGKAHKRYEFGCKVSLAVTTVGNWILSSHAVPGNPYDGHTLSETVERAEGCTGCSVKEVLADRGYRGHDYAGSATVHIVQRLGKAMTRSLRKRLRRRSAIEPTIGHLKQDNRMERNFLKGTAGDELHAVLCAAGYNLRKLLSAFLRALWKWLHQQMARQSRPYPPTLEAA